MIIATAGHVDHGKTLLVKALTGVDTDRLPDEKRRGLTIDLGFAYLPTDAGATIGFVDVPGHEKFVRNALCGLAGTDFVLLIIAGDDGPMPQTREHLAIVDLLGVDRGCVALTKIDRADAARQQEVASEISALLDGTALGGAPVFPVSALTGDGIEALRDHLVQASSEPSRRYQGHNFRLAVDRKFDVAGAGMVVTGTVFSGQVNVGDSVEVLGAEMKLRVRDIHAQNAKASRGTAGQRCALNLAGPELRKDRIGRGDWIVAGPAPPPVQKIDAEITILASERKACSHWTPVHVHGGAAETTGRVALLEEKSLAPGTSGLAQLILDHPLGAVFGDRLIIRDQSAQRTIGGGRVIDLFAPRRGRAKPERIAWIRAMSAHDPRSALVRLLAISEAGVMLDNFGLNRNLTAAELSAVVDGVKAICIPTDQGDIAFSRARWANVTNAVVARLEAWHTANPDAAGIGDNRVLDGSKIKVTRSLAAAIAAQLVRDEVIVRGDFGVRLPHYEARLQGEDAELWATFGKTFRRGELRPFTVRELAADLGHDIRKLEGFLGRAGRLGLIARISKTRYATREMLAELAAIAEDLCRKADDGLVMVTEFRDASGIGRNMAIEVLEYFDRQKFTRRQGEGRILLQPADKVFAGG